MKQAFVALRAAFFAALFLWLWGWMALGARRYDTALGWGLPDWAPVAGVALMLGGGALALTCIGLFAVRGEGTPAPFDAPRKFVAVGPYRWARNPMYLGGWGLLAGFGLFERSAAMALFSFLFLAIAHVFVLAYEEPALRSQFGASYREYCRRVPRWGWGRRFP
jgi:protein-S-isoprenylcysteine O-methyltransferase Ste14